MKVKVIKAFKDGNQELPEGLVRNVTNERGNQGIKDGVYEALKAPKLIKKKAKKASTNEAVKAKNK